MIDKYTYLIHMCDSDCHGGAVCIVQMEMIFRRQVLNLVNML